MSSENKLVSKFYAISENEALARTITAAFVAQKNPTISQLSDIKTAVSEAVTNAIIHGYEGRKGEITLVCAYTGDTIYIEVSDEGVGIVNVEEARQPLYTSKPELERSGMGFTVMEAFMDEVTILSSVEKGTTVSMKKDLSSSDCL